MKVERIRSWGERVGPERGMMIYQNTPDDDNPPAETGVVLDHSWRSMPVSSGDRRGIYLGDNYVQILEGEPAESGSITLRPIKSSHPDVPADHQWCAEFDGYQATAVTKEAAVNGLRAEMVEAGRVAPEHVHDVHGAIKAWMN